MGFFPIILHSSYLPSFLILFNKLYSYLPSSLILLKNLFLYGFYFLSPLTFSYYFQSACSGFYFDFFYNHICAFAFSNLDFFIGLMNYDFYIYIYQDKEAKNFIHFLFFQVDYLCIPLFFVHSILINHNIEKAISCWLQNFIFYIFKKYNFFLTKHFH